MAPLQPPLPTAMNFPFQPDVGIQTSILMSESLDGLSVAATLQNAGSCLKTAFCCAAPWPMPGMPGSENSPAATDSTKVIVAFSRDNVFKLSHVAAYAPDAINRTANRPKPKLRRFMVSLLIVGRFAGNNGRHHTTAGWIAACLERLP